MVFAIGGKSYDVQMSVFAQKPHKKFSNSKYDILNEINI